MDKLANFIEKNSKAIIAIVILITIIMSYFALQIDIKAGIKDMLPEDNPVVKELEDVFDEFGSVAYAVIMLEDEEIIDIATLKKIDQITEELDKIEGLSDIKSLTNIKRIKGTWSGIEVREFVDKLPETAEECEALRQDLLESDQYLNKIVTDDFKSTIILAGIEDEDNPEAVVAKIEELVEKYEGPEKFYITGSPVMVTDATNYMKSDLSHLLPYVIVAIIIILMISFRSFRGVILPIVTVLISVIWAVGMQFLLGKSLSLVSTVLPVLLVSVGSAYAIHIVARYYEELNMGYGISESIKNTINKVGIAVIMAGATTMIGFASLFFSELTIIQDFALGTAFGVGVALLISIFFIPAVLFHISKPRSLKAAEERTLSTNFFKGISHLVLNRRKLIIFFIIILVAASVYVLPRLKPETNYISYFKKDSQTRIATELAEERFGGTQPLSVVIKGNIKDPQLLKAMSDFQDEAELIPTVNNPLSMVTIFREENKALKGGGKEMEVIPTSRQQIAQYLLLLEMSDKELLESYLTFDYNTTRIEMMMETLSSTEQKKVINQLRALIDKHFADNYEVILTGIPLLADEVTNLVVSGQISSLLSAILFTFLVTSLLLKSMKRGFFCTIPIALTILINFGIMGWFGISLDVATAMIASIAVGIGVDYSIHIFTRFLEEKEINDDPVEALKITIFTVGRANLYNAIAVIAGFCVILFSSFPPLISFGGLTAITMVVSFFGSLIILPSLIMSTIKVANKTKERINGKRR